ncbi:MAG: polysaccharide pyruvyl transferase family protein [Pseudomonadota bacterium]|nr:polysaccharide pyruvyl transferase family protein [Pseudomonadota bacterium]
MGYGIKTHLLGYRQYKYLRGRSELGDAMDPAKPLLRYIGWLGHKNIGDEALYLAFKRTLFPNCLLMPFYDLSVTSSLANFKRQRGVVLGGGTLINDDTYLAPLEQAQRAGYTTFLFGTGVGDLEYWSRFPDRNRGNSQRWLRALAKCSYVGVRGPRSQKWLLQNGIETAEIIGDAALAFVPPANPKPVEGPATVGLNLGSHDPVSGGSSHLFEVAIGFSNYLLDQGFHISYISMHSIDHEIGAKLASRLQSDRFSVQPLTADVDEVLAQLLDTQWVVGQRLHATVLACSLGIPNLSLSYQPKCLDFLESIGREDLAVPTDGIALQDLIDRFADLLARSADLQKELTATCDVLRDKQLSTAARLVSTLR